MKFHEAANIFPLLEEKELQELRDDIQRHGQRETIVLYDGQVLDGRNRYTACTLAGIEPRCQAIEDEPGFDADAFDPVAYVLSLNLHRRHLTASQSGIALQLRQKNPCPAEDRGVAGYGSTESGHPRITPCLSTLNSQPSTSFHQQEKDHAKRLRP